MAMKEIFLERLEDRLYDRLKSGALKEWDVSDVINFSNAVIKDKMENINVYLKHNKVTLGNINKAMDEIIDKILIPSIEIK